MKFRGYKLSFELHAAHTNLEYAPNQIHYHTFSIVLWLKRKDQNVDTFDDLEKQVKQFLSVYEDQYLGDTDLFRDSDLTVESMGDIFFRELSNLLNNDRFVLLRLDIWDNPVRQYSITKYRMGMNIHPLNISMLLGTSQVTQIPKQPISAKKNEAFHMQQEASTFTEISTPVIEEPILPQLEEQRKSNKKRRYHLKMGWQVLIALIIFALVVLTIFTYIQGSMISIYGSDTLCHLYRSDYLLSQILQGNLFPMYDPSWYNGVEVMRYWGPLPLYALALIQFIAQGTSLDAYMILIGLLMYGSAIGWLRFGIKYHRVGLAVIIGCIWFLLPENTRVFVLDGNIPRVLISAIFPHLLYSVWMFAHEKQHHQLWIIMTLMSLCVLCHIGMSAMVLVSLLIMLIGYGNLMKQGKQSVLCLCALIIPFLLCGLWSVPSLIGGGAAKGSATNQVMATFFQPLTDSLNPLPHIEGNLGHCYIGLSVFVLCVCGVLIGRRKEKSMFIAGLIIFLCTSMSAYELFVVLPFSQFLWMIRFLPFALGLTLMGFLLWEQLRAWVIGLFCIALIVDVIPSVQFLMQFEGQTSKEVMQYAEELAMREGLVSAKQRTTQRMSVMELSGYGAFAPYYVSGIEPKTSYVFGAGWEGSGISQNIVALNTALELGYYPYIFDRHLELGADTIVFPISYLSRGSRDLAAVKQAGEQAGYELIEEAPTYLTFHYPVDIDTAHFGTSTTYENLAIGDRSLDITMLYPSFAQGESSVLDHYTVEELKQYKRIYASGFTYTNKQKAEAVLKEVSEAGVDIYIDMNSIPVDASSRKQELLGVVAQTYRFSERFPNLTYEGHTYQPALFQRGSTEWNAVTLSGLDDITGVAEELEKDLIFAGTKENEHLHFLGFNMMYHTITTKDQAVTALLNDLFELSATELPKRRIVPLEVTYEPRRITISSLTDDVNTSIAYLDILHSDDIEVKQSLVYVDKGTTIIKLQYPHFNLGLLVSVGGLCMAIGLGVIGKKQKLEVMK